MINSSHPLHAFIDDFTPAIPPKILKFIQPYSPITTTITTTMTSFRADIAHIPPSTFSPTDSILLIIDAQNEYADGLLKITNLPVSRPNIKSLLDAYRAANGYIAHIVHASATSSPVFTPGTPLAAEFTELQPVASSNPEREVTITKRFPGSFAETELGDFVARSGLKKVLLVGYMAHVCVSTTAREAHQRRLDVGVVEDAIGDRDLVGVSGESVREMVLAELGDFFATVVKTADVL
ncbi:hypothetical protein HDV00_004922 [Rhizophlyctis rosea]|nr:hypothetical protein HDV00_004922 [Rhizophlyctis rosea]